MYLPVPVLVAFGLAFLVLVVLALRRGGGGDKRDLIAPPRFGAPTPPTQPMAQTPTAWPAAAAPSASGLAPELDAQVRAMLGAGRKIEAIKLVRDTTRMGLAEAKNLVERM